MGLDFALFNRKRKIKKSHPLVFDAFLDLENYAENILKAKKTGIFTIGGGVPRNWAQQVAPYLDIMHKRVDSECPVCEGKGCKKCDNHGYLSDKSQGSKRYKYAVRICPEPVYWGGLSGCTYSEGVTWGKFVPQEEGGRWSEVLCDATIAWPLILKAVVERLKSENKLGMLKEKQKRVQQCVKDVDALVARIHRVN